MVLICISVRFCNWVRAVSTTCSGQPSSPAAAAIFSITRLMFFSLLSAISLRQLDMASKAAFTDSRALRESPGIAMGSKRWVVVSVDWVMADLLSLIREERLSRESRVGPVVAWERAEHARETYPYEVVFHGWCGLVGSARVPPLARTQTRLLTSADNGFRSTACFARGPAIPTRRRRPD